jgi:hypothetical protein
VTNLTSRSQMPRRGVFRSGTARVSRGSDAPARGPVRANRGLPSGSATLPWPWGRLRTQWSGQAGFRSSGTWAPGNCGDLPEVAGTRFTGHRHLPSAQCSAAGVPGLAKEIEGECRQYSEKRRLRASCSCNDLPAKLDARVAFSLLRVVQEALHSAARHSHAAGVAVEVVAAESGITLEVSDNGIGFDVEQSQLAQGLGLISTRERMW